MFFFYIIENFLGGHYIWDDLLYHFAVPKLYIEHHQIYNNPLNMRSYWIMALHMFYLFGLTIRGVILARGFQISFAFLTALALYSFSRRHFPRWVALLASLAFIADPSIMPVSTVFVEIGSGFFEFLALYAFILWAEEKKDNWLVLSGIFCGMAIGMKYTGAFCFIAVFLLILLYWYRNRASIPLIEISKKVIFFSFVAFLVSFIWYLRNYIYCGNPVFPFLNNFFKSPYWFQHFETADYTGFTMGYSPIKLLLLPWNVYIFNPLFGHSLKGIVFITFLPLLFLLPFVKKDRFPSAVQYLMGYFFIRFFIFAFSTHYSRYFLPVYAELAVLFAYTIYELSRLLPGYSSKVLTGIAVLMVTLNPFLCIFSRGYGFPGVPIQISAQANEIGTSLRQSLGLLTETQLYLNYPEDTYSGGFAAARYVNSQLPKNSKIFLMWTEFGFWYDGDYIYDCDYLPEQGIQVRNTFYRSFYPDIWTENFYRLLKQLKITHVVFNFRSPATEHINIKPQEFFAFQAKHLKMIFNYRNVEVYELL